MYIQKWMHELSTVFLSLGCDQYTQLETFCHCESFHVWWKSLIIHHQIKHFVMQANLILALYQSLWTNMENWMFFFFNDTWNFGENDKDVKRLL